jgi:hypothetical protein
MSAGTGKKKNYLKKNYQITACLLAQVQIKLSTFI